MTDQQENLDQIDDSELFDAALADTPETPVVEEPARDAQGRFAPKAEEAEPAPEPQPQAAPVREEGGEIPSWRLREMREERDSARTELAGIRARFEAMERQMQQASQPKPEPVDIFADPNKWAEQQLSPLEQRMQSLTTNLTLRASRAENIAEHGREKVNAAEKAIGEAMQSGDPELSGLRAKMLASDNPVGVAVEWHQSRSLLKETGGNLESYRQKILDEAMKDPAFQAKVIEARGAAQPKNITRLPPSLNKIAGSAGNDAGGHDMSDAGLFAHALR